MKIPLEDFNTRVERERERIFSNQQLGTRTYIRIIMIMVLE
jgi:hypothetical protein